MTAFDNEMMAALEADGEKLRALTGEDHGPYFLSDAPDPITIDEVMEQAQVFASAYALVGGRFDDGSRLRLSQDEKDNLECMVRMLANEAILAERERCACVVEALVDDAGDRYPIAQLMADVIRGEA